MVNINREFLILTPDIRRCFAEQSQLFDQIMMLTGKVYRALENRKTQEIILNHQRYFIKQHFGIGWKEILKNLSFLRLPVLSAKNEWQAIQALERLNIPTTKLVGYGKRGFNPARIRSFIITEALANMESLAEVALRWQSQPPTYLEKQLLIRELATIARKLHEHGINHRDFYLCHFLVDKASFASQVFKLYVIDLHRVQIRRQVPERWRVKDVAGLYFSSMDCSLTQRDILRFLQIYLAKPWREVLKKQKNFLKLVEKRAHKLYKKHHHITPKLKIYFD